MISHGAHDDATLEPTTWLQMPQQTPPVDRNEATPAAALDGPALQANGWAGLPQPFVPWHLTNPFSF
ncbi:hypothetical protein ACFYVK_39865 [Streptomyces chartreusis]|uniref:hypothetical protein n=1 Tax=Streptomyces chartreusis TaxID=1969 RepID=UPI00369C3292